MATASGAPTAAASASASASARRRRAVTRPSVKTHRGHRRGLRNHAAAPATPTSSKAVTREECYEFVRSGCKPKESFRCGRDAMVMRCARDARCDGGETRDDVDSFRGFRLDCVWAQRREEGRRSVGRNLKPGCEAVGGRTHRYARE